MAGVRSTGVGGVASRVVKRRTAERLPKPPAFFAATLQKYLVLYASADVVATVSVNVESLKTMPVANVESEATCSLYAVAVAGLLQIRVGVIEIAVALSAGEIRVGAAGVATPVVKLCAVE